MFRLTLSLLGLLLLLCGARAIAQEARPDSALAAAIFEELIEIPSVSETPETYTAARAMAQRLLDAGFPADDVRVVGPDSTTGNLVAVYRGAGTRPPLLLMAHLDVVPALREDWSTDPFTLTKQDGWWYARGSTDNKAGAAMLVANFIRLKREGFVPDRDLIIALTGDEETSSASIRWLAAGEGRELIGDPAFALNTDAGGGILDSGRERSFDVQAAEKIYLTFRLEVTNPGGHSSIPRADNAINRLAAGLVRLAGHRFPIEITEIARGFFARTAELVTDGASADMRATGAGDPEAAERLAASSPYYNALLRTTCIATRLEAGHADNALPQTARATVNCRILPTGTADDVERVLREVLADSAIAVTRAAEPTPSPPSPLVPEVLGPVEALVEELWPGVPVIPTMSTGATDGLYVRNAGIPVYGVAAIFEDPEDARAHGRDERISIARFYEALEFWYRMVKAFSAREVS
jgi:acetylornithine deacetylase/succinyl-diaminopimelate desuccinylase-like protein